MNGDFAEIPKKEREFSVRKEDWSKYEILDGKGVLWVREIVTKIYEFTGEQKQGDPPNFITGSTNVVTAFFFDDALKGTPANRPITPEEYEDKGTDIPWNMIEEPFSEYQVAGKPAYLLRTKTVLAGLRWIPSLHNMFGDPLVQTNSQLVVARPIRIDAAELDEV